MSYRSAINTTDAIYRLLKKIEIYQHNADKLQSFLDKATSDLSKLNQEQLQALPKVQADVKKLKEIVAEYQTKIDQICTEYNCSHLLEVAKVMTAFHI